MANKRKYDWEALHSEFTRSNITLRDLARRHNVNYYYLAQKSSKEGWYEQREVVQKQAREAVHEELAKQVGEQNSALSKIVCKDGEQHLKRSLQVGDRLYGLFQAAVAAMTQGNMREMRSAIDAWVTLDNQMRKIHRIEEKSDKPLVNINVLSALPPKEKMKRVTDMV